MYQAFYGKYNGIFCACTVCTRPLLGGRGLGTRLTVLYAELRWNYETFIPSACVGTGGGRSGGVVTVADGGMGDVPCGVMLKEEEDRY